MLYYSYIYGALINACIHEELALFNVIKLRNQMKFRLGEKKTVG